MAQSQFQTQLPSQSGGAAPLPAAPASEAARGVPFSISVDARVAATDNGGLDPGGSERADLITSLRPELAASREGAGLSFDLKAAVTLLDYARGTQSNSALPDLHGAVRSTLADRWLYLDAGAYLRYAEADPFGARANDVTGANRRVESGLLVEPRLQHDFGPNATLLAKESISSSANDAGDGTRLTSRLSLLRFERRPTPLGVSAEVSQLVNRAGDGEAGRYELATARLRGLLLAVEDLELGAVVGRDRSDYLLSRHDDALYGGSLKWVPGPRTRLEFELEHRYFGSSGVLALSHRTPFTTIEIQLKRQPLDSSSTFGTLAQGADLRGFLDAMLTTRYPDASTRAGVVDGIISSRGLDTKASGAVDVIGDYPQLQTSGEIAWTLLGPINVLVVRAYEATTRALVRDGEPLVGRAGAVADGRQRGASLQLNHRLGPQLSADVQASWSRYEGLGDTAGQASSEQHYRTSLAQHLSPRTLVSAALEWNRFRTNAAGQHSFDATFAIIGMNHRF